MSIEKLVACDEFFKHHYRREGGVGREAKKLQKSCLRKFNRFFRCG